MSKYWDCMEQAESADDAEACAALLSQEDEFDDDEFDDDWEDDEDEYEHDDGYDPMWDDDETWRQ